MALNFNETEKEILKYWKEDNTFEKSLSKKGKNFVFFEGPPTANGKPGIHHVLSRVFKDVICRYKTMQGFKVIRKAGWDTHGLPVELETEKEIGLHSKKDIEKYGIAAFNQKCKESVWKYVQDWQDLTQRIAYWLDMDNPYITYDASYMESVWWIIKQISDKGLLYKGHRVVPYCPRCGTVLSSHEVAQGYKTIKEPSVYVKLKIKNPSSHPVFSKIKGDISLLVWTTTPWTLPANVAVAVNKNIDYIAVEINNEVLVLAKDRKDILKGEYKIISQFKGKDLQELEYEPLFNLAKDNAYKVLLGDFVSTEEGTGLVHIAPAFGEDDMKLIQEWNLNHKDKPFPILLFVDSEGKFKAEVKEWAGMFVKNADPLIIKHLSENGKVFAVEDYEHEYPFCWRCKTPLLYYAKEGWFIRMSALKEKLKANNEKINWVPSHIKNGRFGEWLEDVKDWALSRERYWGTPLPVWECKQCQHQEVIGSRQDLLKQTFSKNKYFLVRHGESRNVVEEIRSSFPELGEFPLTEKGIKEAQKAAVNLKKQKIDFIFSSDLLRTKQTAEIIAKELNTPIIYDDRLREIGAGDLNGKPRNHAETFFTPEENKSLRSRTIRRFKDPFPGGETYAQMRTRLIDFMREIDSKYDGKNIVIVGHIANILLLESSSSGMNIQETGEYHEKLKCDTAAVRELEFKDFPYNDQGEIDLHRPYIDQVKFQCPECKSKMQRVPEVIDCWFDSGSMPFAQYHYPFENKNFIEKKEQFPAEYIAEAIDQTRGWFYTLLAIATLLGLESPYKNVIVLGHVLDKKGQKMSKSVGNIVNPWEVIEKYGADALRWYFFTINQPGEPKLFDEKNVDQSLKKFLMTFWNCLVFLKTYNTKEILAKKPKPANLLDKWILSRLNSVIEKVTKDLESYDVFSSARLIEDFVVNDLSLWYVRRSRSRFQQPVNSKELDQASMVLGYILFETSKMCAPFVPFVSEKAMQESGSKISVHLYSWPKADKKIIDKDLEKEMDLIRQAASLALNLRNQAQIKVRQPLAEANINFGGAKVQEELLRILEDELNIRSIKIVDEIESRNNWVNGQAGKISVSINIQIPEELKEEGILRDVIRFIQDSRKKAGCTPQDKITIVFVASDYLKTILIKNETIILNQTKTKGIKYVNQKPATIPFFQQDGRIENDDVWLGIEK